MAKRKGQQLVGCWPEKTDPSSIDLEQSAEELGHQGRGAKKGETAAQKHQGSGYPDSGLDAHGLSAVKMDLVSFHDKPP